MTDQDPNDRSATGQDQPLAIFRLVPWAQAFDPRWDIAPGHGIVIVRAHSPADARVVAADGEVDFLEIGAKPSHGVTTRFASAFRDELLYKVVEDTSGRYPPDGPREIVAVEPSPTDHP